jgi:hypothetical protein
MEGNILQRMDMPIKSLDMVDFKHGYHKSPVVE